MPLRLRTGKMDAVSAPQVARQVARTVAARNGSIPRRPWAARPRPAAGAVTRIRLGPRATARMPVLSAARQSRGAARAM